MDKVVDNAAFDAIAYRVQKDLPYEKIIDFVWLYGKLEPGRYHIVKTVTDFRGTRDYTNYAFTAEFSIEGRCAVHTLKGVVDKNGIGGGKRNDIEE